MSVDGTADAARGATIAVGSRTGRRRQKVPGQMVEMSSDGSAIRETYEPSGSQATNGSGEINDPFRHTITETIAELPGQMVEMSSDDSAIRETDMEVGTTPGEPMEKTVAGTTAPTSFALAGTGRTATTGAGSGELLRKFRFPLRCRRRGGLGRERPLLPSAGRSLAPDDSSSFEPTGSGLIPGFGGQGLDCGRGVLRPGGLARTTASST